MPTVWGLLDNRPGTAGQVRGVVERLGFPSVFKQIHYTPLAALPNGLRGQTLRGIHTKKSDELLPPWPDVVVTAGRRLAPAALYIKRQHPEVFLVHLMLPGMATQVFDLLALPSHDRVLNQPNIVRTLGAPHAITPQALIEAAAKAEPMFAACQGFRVGVLIGGNTSHGALREEDLRRLLAHLRRISGMAALLVTTSRRTPEFVAPMLEAALKDRPYYFYRYGEGGGNPYFGILGASDVLVVTGESISLCSEACSTGKPVYIFSPRHTLSEKHQRFLSLLFNQNLARPIEEYDPDWRPGSRLDEAGRLAGIIRQKLGDRKSLSKL